MIVNIPQRVLYTCATETFHVQLYMRFTTIICAHVARTNHIPNIPPLQCYLIFATLAESWLISIPYLV